MLLSGHKQPVKVARLISDARFDHIGLFSEGLCVALCRLKPTAFFVHKFEMSLNKQYFISDWFHLKVFVQETKFARVNEECAKEVAGNTIVERLRSDVLWKEAANKVLGKIFVQSFVEMLNCVSQISREEWTLFSHQKC